MRPSARLKKYGHRDESDVANYEHDGRQGQRLETVGVTGGHNYIGQENVHNSSQENQIISAVELPAAEYGR